MTEHTERPSFNGYLKHYARVIAPRVMMIHAAMYGLSGSVAPMGLAEEAKYFLPRCFDQAVGEPSDEEEQGPADPVLPVHIKDGMAAGDPSQLAPPVQEKVDDAIVKITLRAKGSQASGSGFVTLDPRGNPVVVTAAHVAAHVPRHNIHLTDNDGNTTTVQSGCYMFERDGKQIETSGADEKGWDGAARELDVAILRPWSILGSAALKLAERPAQRGDWIAFANFQAGKEPGGPARYTGLAVSGGSSQVTALTGLRHVAKEAAPPFVDYHLFPGGSGGAVVEQAGDVVGVSVRALQVSTTYVKRYYHLDVTGEPHVFEPDPVAGALIPAAVVEEALESSRY